MDREGFLDAVRKEFADEIHSAYLECEHSDARGVDYARLNQRLRKLMAHAETEGLPAKEFVAIVRSTLPEAWARIDLGGSGKLAA